MDDDAVHGILMRLRGFSFAMNDRVRHAIPHGLNMQHAMVMRVLITHGPVPQGQLVEHLGITKGAVSQTVSQLEERGFVERRKDADDGRIQWVHPTAQADALRKGLEEHVTELFRDVFQDWTDTDAKRVAKLLDGLVERAKKLD